MVSRDVGVSRDTGDAVVFGDTGDAVVFGETGAQRHWKHWSAEVTGDNGDAGVTGETGITETQRSPEIVEHRGHWRHRGAVGVHGVGI